MRTGLAIIPFAVGCVLAERYWPAHNLFVFFLQIAALLPLFPLTLALIFRKGALVQAREWYKRRNVSKSSSQGV